MTFALASQFHVYTYCGVKARLAYCLNSVLNVKALIGAFNQEKALVGAFSVIVQFHRLIVYGTSYFSLDFQFHEFHVCRLEELERQSKGSGSVTSSGSESSRSFSLKSTQSVGAP